MNLPHLHILLNHFPTVGFSIGLALFVVALLSKSHDLKRASLAVMFLIAMLSLAVYTTGNAAARAICPAEPPPAVCPPGVEMTTIVAHEDAALLAYILMQVSGAFAFIGLWQMRRIARLGGGIASAVLILSVATFGLMARAATMGGEIRHPEILEAAAASKSGTGVPAPAAGAGEITGPAETKPAEKPVQPSAHFEIEWLKAETIKNFVVRDHSWVWPACETLHFVGLSLLFGVVLIVDLRMLGLAKSLSFQSLHKLLPWGLVGFGINLVTGMAFFIATPHQYAENIMFFWKVVGILLAGTNAMYFLVFDQAWSVKSGDDAPFASKAAAASAIFLWLGVLFCGHMLPFLGNAF